MSQDPVSDFLAQDATSLVRQKADEYGVPADFAERVLNKETRKRADIITGRTRSPKGATGAMQLMPETAARLGVQDPTDYTQNIDGGVRELARLYKQYNGDQSLVAAGYNAGEGAVKKYGGKVPPYRETQDYVKEVASDPVQDFLNGSAAVPAATPQKTAIPRPVKTESEYPVLRAPSDVSTALFDWRSGGTQGILADSARNAEVVKEAQRNQSPQRQRERASAVASGQNALERGASQFFNAAAKGVAGIPQGVAELSDLVGEYQPAARLGNAIQGMITGQKPQRLAPQIAPYTQQVQAAIDRDVPIDVNDQSWLTAKIPGAVGSLAPFIAGGILSGGSRAVTGLLGAAGNAGDIGKEFDDAGGDPANRDKAIALAAATGLSEVLGVGKLLAKFGKNQGVMQAAKTVLEEGGQEAFQQWVNNLNAANVGAYDPNRSQLEGVGEAAALGGLLGGGLSGVSNIAARRAQQPQVDRAPAPIAPVAPRSADTNLNPDEVLTPATGAQPIIDPVTGLPQAEVSNPATEAKVDDLFAGILGRKPNPAAEKAKVKAQEAQAYRQAAEEAAAAGDVGRQMDALKEALQRETDPQVRLDIQAELRALAPAPATRKLSGQRAPAEPTLPTPPAFERAPETAALSDDVANAPTSDLPEVDPGQQALISAGERRAQAKTEKNYALAESIAAGELAGLQARQKQIDPNDVQQVIQFASAVRALQLEIKGLQKLQAEEAKAVAPARAPRAAVLKTPKGPKVAIPKAEGVRKGQGVLSGVAPDQIELIGNPLAEENQSGGIPPVEPVAKNVLPFEELAGRAKAKVNKRANMSPVEYLKQASQGEGFRVTDSGEAEGVSAKDAKIVAFTNQNSQYGMNDAAVMLDEGGYFLPDGRRFTDQDVKEADVLDYLKQYGKQSSAGNTGGVDPRIAAEEAAYYEQQAANEGAPTTSTRLPSGLIAESRRPQPIETPRSTPDYRQKALDRINAAELPDNAKQRYRDWLEQGRLTDSDVLNDPDLAPAAQSTPAEQVQEVEMRRTGTDNAPVVEMPKRATPPQPIPEELSRVYGGKITPEQSDAIQRRAKNRASVEIGLGGKFGDMARKSFMSSGGTTELPPLVSHPALREALGLPEMPAYLVEDGRVSKLWQEAAQHVLDGLAEWGGVARSSRAGDDGLGRIGDAIAERINDRTLYEAFGRTVVATDTAQKRLSAVLDRPEVKTAIEAAQAEIADQRARGLKSLALRKSGKALDEALRTASEQALKDFPADAIGSYGKDWSEITKSAIEEFRADIRAERLGPDGSPESWIGRRFRESIGKADGGQARESQAAQGNGEQPAASPAKSSAGRAPAPAQESPQLQAPTEIVEPRVGGYVRKDGRIYEIVKYHPKEGTVWIQEPGSPGAQAIPQSEVRKLTIPDDVAKAEIGETSKEGQESGDAHPKVRSKGRRGEAGAILNPFAKSPKPEIVQREIKGESGERYAEVRLGEQKFKVKTQDKTGTKLHVDDTTIIKHAQTEFAQETVQTLADVCASQFTNREVQAQAAQIAAQIRAAVNRGDWIVASRLNKKLQGIKGATTFDVEQFVKQAKSALNSKVVSPATEKAILDAAQEVAQGLQAGNLKAVEAGRLKLLGIRDDLKAEVNVKPTEKNALNKVATVHSITQLLAPVTAMRNFLSNTAYALGRNVDTLVAAGIDKAISGATKERTVVPPKRGQISDLKAEMKRAYAEVKRGNLGVLRESQFGLADHHALESKVGKFFEKALAVSLKVPDAGFFHAAYNESVRNQIDAQSKSARPTQSLEQIHERAVNEALQGVFADNNKATRAAIALKDKINFGEAWGAADVLGMRYVKVPVNLAVRVLEHSPAGFIRELYNLSKVARNKAEFDQRRTSINLSKSLTGTFGAMGLGYLMATLGILVDEPDPSDSIAEQAVQSSTGMPRYGLNLSAAKRYALGGIADLLAKGDTSSGKLLRGDVLASYDWLQPHAALLSIGASLHGKTNKQNANAIEVMLSSLDGGFSVLQDQTVLRLARDWGREAFKEGKGPVQATQNLLYKGVVNLPASFVPGILGSVRQITDNTSRDTRPEQPGKTIQQKGRAMVEEIGKRAVSRVPVLSQRLPVRPDVTGEPRKAPQDKFANPQALINPAKLSEYQPNDYTDALVRLGMGASYTPRFISKTDAMPEPTSKLREREIERGRAEMEKGNRLVNSDSFKKADPDKQKEMIRAMRAKVTETQSGRRKSSGYPFVDAQSKEGRKVITGSQ